MVQTPQGCIYSNNDTPHYRKKNEAVEILASRFWATEIGDLKLQEAGAELRFNHDPDTCRKELQPAFSESGHDSLIELSWQEHRLHSLKRLKTSS